MKVKHFHTSAGRDLIADFLVECPKEIRQDYFDAISLLEAGKILEMPLSRPLSNIFFGLHELRLKDKGGIFRFFYFIKKKDAIFVLHAFKKKTQTLPQKERELVLKRIKVI